MGLLSGEDLDGLVEGREDGDTTLLVEVDDLLANHGDVYTRSESYPHMRQGEWNVLEPVRPNFS